MAIVRAQGTTLRPIWLTCFFISILTVDGQALLELTVRGFIVPGEAVNMAIFDPDLTYEFQLEGTGDAIP